MNNRVKVSLNVIHPLAVKAFNHLVKLRDGEWNALQRAHNERWPDWENRNFLYKLFFRSSHDHDLRVLQIRKDDVYQEYKEILETLKQVEELYGNQCFVNEIEISADHLSDILFYSEDDDNE